MEQIWQALILGQLLSLLLTGTAFSSSLLVREGVNAPTAQSFLNYVLLGIFNGARLCVQRKRLKGTWYLYLLLAFLDLEANYIVVKAYQYTSITSVMLLDCWTIPCVMLLTWIFLSTQYQRGHFIGVFLCIIGLVLAVVSDVHAGDRSGGSNALLGDALVFLGATFYGITNVYEEFLVNRFDREELLALVGIFGSVISASQILLLERHELRTITSSINAVVPFVAFSVCLFLFSILVPKLLQIGGSALMNLSFLTSDMYTVAIRVLLYNQSVDWIYFVSFATVTTGILYYSSCGEAVEQTVRRGIAYERVDAAAEPELKPSDAVSTHDCQFSEIPINPPTVRQLHQDRRDDFCGNEAQLEIREANPCTQNPLSGEMPIPKQGSNMQYGKAHQKIILRSKRHIDLEFQGTLEQGANLLGVPNESTFQSRCALAEPSNNDENNERCVLPYNAFAQRAHRPPPIS